MANVALLLGPIAFQDFEIPSGINFGGGQRLTVHRLPGGSRVIDALGRDDSQISFCGIFSGSDATLRARSLDELRVAGIALPLTWDVFYYTVLISAFQADYCNACWIPYRIICTVLQDEASELVELGLSLAAAALSDIGTAAGFVSGTGLNMAPLQTALMEPGATTRGTDAFAAAQSSLFDARSAIDSGIKGSSAVLEGIDVSGAETPQAGAAGLLAATAAAGRSSSLYSARAFVERAASNLANAST